MSLAEALAQARVVAVSRQGRYEDPAAIATALRAGGLNAIEFTFTGRNAAEAISAVKAIHPDMLVAAGTVLDKPMFDAALEAGADCAFSPALDPELIRAVGPDLLIPGALTPSEVSHARRLGCRVVKIFPARLGGPAYIAELRSVFPEMAYVPSGGLTEANCTAYLEAGAVAACLGASLLGAMGKPASPETVRRQARAVLERLEALPPRAAASGTERPER
jgi:2-dehydro-3-deoxyphosphogluconate aldolase / (4S)-4-hydroxy-2-oxoglutarate aldolase